MSWDYKPARLVLKWFFCWRCFWVFPHNRGNSRLLHGRIDFSTDIVDEKGLCPLVVLVPTRLKLRLYFDVWAAGREFEWGGSFFRCINYSQHLIHVMNRFGCVMLVDIVSVVNQFDGYRGDAFVCGGRHFLKPVKRDGLKFWRSTHLVVSERFLVRFDQVS